MSFKEITIDNINFYFENIEGIDNFANTLIKYNDNNIIIITIYKHFLFHLLFKL